jgi:anionic cell wall polymer biosynthesis LytR-Cps2A-Psr (LCP) family protein
MEKLEFARALGEKIIKSQHDYFETAKSEDLDHITNLKRIIEAIAEYLKSEIVSEEEVDDLVEHFRRFSKTLYINNCINNKEEDENEGQIREESEIWFDYIFENEKYPR